MTVFTQTGCCEVVNDNAMFIGDYLLQQLANLS